MYQFGDQQSDNGAYGDRLAERVMTMQYNLAVQRGDNAQAANVLARLLGFLLSRRS